MKLSLRSALILALGLALGSTMLLTNGAADTTSDLMKRTDTITDKVANLRGLSRKKFIKRGVMDKDAIRKRLIIRIEEEYTAEELIAEELALKRLRLLPADANYKKLVIDLFTEQIAGFYDPKDQHLYIADSPSGGPDILSDILMAHEIDHALQDQHFGLERFMKPDKQNSDATVARQSLVEGDGTALMFEYMMKDMGQDMPWTDSRTTQALIDQMSAAVAVQNNLDNVPMVLREGMVFPYMNGLGFVAHFRRHHAWSRVNEMYRKPPLSTEHILHPEKYDAYERPDTITTGAIATLSDHTKVYDNVNGELGLFILLRQHAGSKVHSKRDVAKEKAERASAGWGGDRIAMYTAPGHRGGSDGAVGVMYSVWDQVADAIEFFDVLSDSMASLSGAKVLRTTDDEVLYRGTDGVEFLAQRRGDAVVIVLGAPKDKGQRVISDVWKTWKVKRR